MSTKYLAQKIFKKFSKFEGNQHIANEYALECILKLVKDFKVESILEIGIGIGCIADAVLEYSSNIDYTATEANEYCLEAIKKNISQIQRVKLYKDLSEVPANKTFDFIIIDGSDEALIQIEKMCKPTTIIFIEGSRVPQTEKIKKIFPQILHTEMISNYKNPSYGPFPTSHWCGGGQLLFPFPDFKMKNYYYKEKISTFLKRKKRMLSN